MKAGRKDRRGGARNLDMRRQNSEELHRVSSSLGLQFDALSKAEYRKFRTYRLDGHGAESALAAVQDPFYSCLWLRGTAAEQELKSDAKAHGHTELRHVAACYGLSVSRLECRVRRGLTGEALRRPEKYVTAPTVTLLAYAIAHGLEAEVRACWLDKNEQNGIHLAGPDAVGCHTDAEAYWRCPRCGDSFQRRVGVWFRAWAQGSKTRGSPIPVCRRCDFAAKGEALRADSIKAMAAAGDNAAAVLLRWWDNDANAVSADVERPTSNEERQWRCRAGHKWAAPPKRGYNTLKGVIQQGGWGQAPPDHAACPQCKADISWPQVALAQELSLFFAVESEHAGLRAVKRHGKTYHVDMALPEIRWYVEYDGFAFHGGGHTKIDREKQVERDTEKSMSLAQNTGWRVLRVREMRRGQSLPVLVGCSQVHVNGEETAYQHTVCVLKVLAAMGVHPTRKSADEVRCYIDAQEWCTADRAREVFRRLDQGVDQGEHWRDYVRASSTHALVMAMQAMADSEGAQGIVARFADSIGSNSKKFSTAVKKYHRHTPIELLVRAGTRGLTQQQQSAGTKSSLLDDYSHLIGMETDEEVARRSGCTAANVRAKRKKLGMPCAPLKRHYKRLETDLEMAREIRAAYLLGATVATLMSQHKKSKSEVYRMLRGEQKYAALGASVIAP